jgi:outer membrane protein assembly factor BamB
MVGVANKNGLWYAFDRSTISSGPLWSRRASYGGGCPECGRSNISPSAWDGQHLFVGGEKGNVHRVTCPGTLRELNPATGGNVWQECLNTGPVLGAVTGVPGVGFAAAGKSVFAFNMSTGAMLWTFQDTSTGSNFWGAATISNGIVYIGNQDGKLYAFNT